MREDFTVDVAVRYRDLDTLNVVNNAVYATYFEHARTEYVDRVLDMTLEEYNFVLATLEISFERPITMGDEPRVAVRVSELGRSSLVMHYEVRVGDDIAATGESTIVFVDPDTGSSEPIPASTREQITEFEGLEE